MGTLQYHAFISTQDRKLLMKNFSSSEKYDIFPKGQKKQTAEEVREITSKSEKNRLETQFYEISYV